MKQNTRFNVQIFDSVDQFKQSEWDPFVDKAKLSIQFQHLKSIEKSGINNIEPRYMFIFQGEKAVGIAYYFFMEMDLTTTFDTIEPETAQVIKNWFPDFLKFKALECGLLSGLGQSFLFQGDDSSSYMTELLNTLEQDGLDHGADFILFRDIEGEQYPVYEELFSDQGFEAIRGFPAARMKINWPDYASYLAHYTSKKRNNIKRKQKKLRREEITVEKIDNFGHLAPTLFNLWRNVYDRSETYNHEYLNPAYFEQINKNLDQESFIIAVKKQEEIIAYCLCFLGEEEYFMDFVGIDYNWNTEYFLYFNLFYLAIEDAIKRGSRIINFGITTYEFKLEIGSDLFPYVYMLKHIKDPAITHSFARLIDELIEKPEVDEIHHKLISRKKHKAHDLFSDISRNERVDMLKLMNFYKVFFPAFESAQKATVFLEGKELIMLGSNSYLGLGNDPRTIKTAQEAINKYGTGCSGSPLMNGTLDIHEQLKTAMARFLNKEDGLIYSTGYQTNLGVMGALAQPKDIIFVDQFCHASIIDGALYSRARIMRFRHNDLDHLEEKMKQFPTRKKLVVADSIYSMEGTLVDLPRLVELVKRYDARLVLDEAHAIGVYGKNGKGVAEHFGLMGEVDLITGTFSKAFAAVGGFVVGDNRIIDYLRAHSRPLIFSASTPPSVVATVMKSLEIIQNEPERRKKTIENARYMARGLKKLGYEAPYYDTAIVPIYCRDELITLSLFNKLMKEGVYVNPVLSPAVPKGGELLRTSYMTDHTKEHLDKVLSIFEKLRTTHFPATR